jgi:hypothetical protein
MLMLWLFATVSSFARCLPLLPDIVAHCLLACRQPSPLSTAAAIIIATPLLLPPIAAAPANSCCRLLSAAAILAISGPPLLLPFLICGRNLYHLLSAITAPLVSATNPHLRQSLVASILTSHPLVPPALACRCHHLFSSSPISLRPLQFAFACPPSYINLVDCHIIAIFSQCFVSSQNVTMGDTIGNPTTTKTGNTVTCQV